MAIVRDGHLRCPDCREYVIEIDPADFPDGLPQNDESPTPCSGCRTHTDADATDLRTVVADWETIEEDGCTVSPDLLPVVITVPATSHAEALQAAAAKLQDYLGPHVEALNMKHIEPDRWFGTNDTDPLLRVCAIFIGRPVLDDDGKDTAIYLC